ncbi:helix-turn-helix domain-containing protein [Roseisalinus antarcticus]|uniref:Transposon Tn10 TetD protein n=1 Tax=Roseisalinus antarcticus TaxID=254357 RepID=A0A1Y5THA8_9RHOB|nr:AraC family transcriptional regulator [Roseisalinus antarcticus]SLN64045.1 Transposon Tn10 TetD protein [Roseisalinus antarcticus]
MSKALAVSHGEFGRAAVYELDRTISTHAHREGHLIFWIGGAPADVQVGRERFSCDGQMATAVSPWAPHSFHAPHSEPCACLVLYIKPMWFLEHAAKAEFSLAFGRARLQVTPQIASLVHLLAAGMLDDSTQSGINGLLFELAHHCYEVSWRGQRRPGFLSTRRGLSDFRVRRSQQLMREALSTHPGMDALASEVGLSRPHFFRLFKEQTGVTPNLYFNTLRSEAAIDDLMSSDKSITDIGFDLGFASQASFTRFFSLNVGISPTDYRRVAHLH